MDTKKCKLEENIAALTRAIGENPDDGRLYLERGKLYHRRSEFDKALNDFIRVTDLSGEEHREAEGYIAMIRGIFDFRYMESYNV